MGMTDYKPFPHTFHGHLYQASMWRDYVKAWDGGCTRTGVDRAWLEWTQSPSREECLRRARVHAELARSLNAAHRP